MRIAFATWSDRRAGGVESYIERVIPHITALDHEVMLWHETGEPRTRAQTLLPAGCSKRQIAGPSEVGGLAEALRPDAIFIQGLHDVEIEAALLRLPGTVFVAHNYTGTCISGTRAWTLPSVRPCKRRLGPGCLLHYLPHGCGGRSPLTMVRHYSREQQRQRSLKQSTVVTLSSHMRDVFLDHGFSADSVLCVPYGPPAGVASQIRTDRSDSVTRLMAVGRLERIKGMHLLIDALPAVHACAGRIRLLILGEGRAEPELRAQAERCTATQPGIEIVFAGWMSPEDRDRAMCESDVLVMPSAWPEPLGLVGMEALAVGLPVIAYDLGGIRDWLVDGRNGRLVNASPPTAEGLADALCEWLKTSAHTPVAPRAGAPTPESHARGLIQVAERIRHLIPN